MSPSILITVTRYYSAQVSAQMHSPHKCTLCSHPLWTRWDRRPTLLERGQVHNQRLYLFTEAQRCHTTEFRTFWLIIVILLTKMPFALFVWRLNRACDTLHSSRSPRHCVNCAVSPFVHVHTSVCRQHRPELYNRCGNYTFVVNIATFDHDHTQ